MKRLERLTLIAASGIVAIAVASFALPPVAAASGDEIGPLWKAVASSGPVQSREVLAAEDDWIKVQRGDEYQPRTYLRTGKRGKATLAQYDHVLIVRSNSALQLPDLNSSDPDSQTYQDSGRVTYEVDGTRFERFEVVTPYLIAGVKGTVFTVTVSKGFTSVSVEEGLVEVTSRFDDSTMELRPGQEVFFEAGQTDRLEVRQADTRAAAKTRHEVRTARKRITGSGNEGVHTASLEGPGNGMAAGADPIDLTAGNRASGETGMDDLLEQELSSKGNLAMDEIEKISKEEMKDLDSKKAMQGDPADASGTQQ